MGPLDIRGQEKRRLLEFQANQARYNNKSTSDKKSTSFSRVTLSSIGPVKTKREFFDMMARFPHMQQATERTLERHTDEEFFRRGYRNRCRNHNCPGVIVLKKGSNLKEGAYLESNNFHTCIPGMQDLFPLSAFREAQAAAIRADLEKGNFWSLVKLIPTDDLHKKAPRLIYPDMIERAQELGIGEIARKAAGTLYTKRKRTVWGRVLIQECIGRAKKKKKIPMPTCMELREFMSCTRTEAETGVCYISCELPL
jgi:hypothetical protein